MRSGKPTRIAALALLAVAAAAAVLPAASPSASGVWQADERGCYCHNARPSENVGFSVTGLPGLYAPGANYTVVIRVTLTDVGAVANKSQGGFHLEATAGNFSVPPGMEGRVQVQGAVATHTLNGSRMREWSVNWTAPDTPGMEVTFTLFVLTANGSGSETFGQDHWTLKTVLIGVGPEPVIRGPPAPVPPLAIETYALLAVGAAAALYAFLLYRSARRPSRGGTREGAGPPEVPGPHGQGDAERPQGPSK